MKVNRPLRTEEDYTHALAAVRRLWGAPEGSAAGNPLDLLLVLVSVTLLMWITQALRDIDLMTNEGQNILVFIGITGLIIPLLILIIAPIAFMVAMAYVLNKLGTDSELIVMNAAGMPPWHLFRPFLAVAGLVIGAAATLMLARLLSSFSHLLYGVRASDPLTFITASLVLMAAALLASCLPARRAMRVDPMQALRSE